MTFRGVGAAMLNVVLALETDVATCYARFKTRLGGFPSADEECTAYMYFAERKMKGKTWFGPVFFFPLGKQ